MKYCPSCQMNKPFCEFYYSNSRFQSGCKSCRKDKAKQRMRERYSSDSLFRTQQIERAKTRNAEKRDELLVYWKDYNANRRKKPVDNHK